MPKRVTTVSTTVVREGKRVEVAAGKPYDFTADEIKDLNRIHPGALRKGVNETADEPTNETAPEGESGATATKTPVTNKRKAAAEKDSTSKEATGGDKADATGTGTTDEDDDI